ncbi:MAG: hypothetical protein V3T01_09435 [Myxococcota bacterium]
MLTRIVSLLLVLLLGVAAYSGYRLLLAGIEVDVYRERLVELRRDHDQLRKQYNQAVRRTAVTELLVNDGKLRVSIRTAEGELRTLETPYDPSREIYVDYVIIDGRLWIRRVFDANTAPGEGMVIDPALVDIDWDVARAAHGKAAYRPLDEGRWVVTVTGDGSLGLARVDAARVELSGPPAVREYTPVGESVDAVLRELTAAEMLRSLARRLSLVPLLSDS